MAESWAGVLDDLEARLTAAESGALEALGGWSAPTGGLPVMAPDEEARARALNDRQRALEAGLRRDMARVAAARAASRNRAANRWGQESVPVYVDRSV